MMIKYTNQETAQVNEVNNNQPAKELKKRGRKPGSKVVKTVTTEKFETGISINNLINWNIVDGIKEFLQNLVYAKSSLKNKISISYDEEFKTVILHNTPSGFEKKFLLIGESNQRGKIGAPGEFGEGMKVAFAVLLRNGIEIEVQTNNFKVVPSLGASSLDSNVKVLWYNIENNWIKGGTTVIIKGIEKEDLEIARSFFLLLNDDFKTEVNTIDQEQTEEFIEILKEEYNYVDSKTVESDVLEAIEEINQERIEKRNSKKVGFKTKQKLTKTNCILGIAENGQGKIYVNGVKIQEIPALFDYNFINTGSDLLNNRDRNALDVKLLKPAIRSLINELTNKEYIEVLLKNACIENETIENSIKFYASDIKNYGKSKVWVKVRNQIWPKKTCLHGGNDSEANYRGFKILEINDYEWSEVFTDILGIKKSQNIFQDAKKVKNTVVKLKELTEIERKNLNWSKKMIRDYYCDLWKIKIVDGLKDEFDNNCEGLCDRQNKIVWINRKELKERKTCFETLIHEFVHKETKAGDKTVEFERGFESACFMLTNREKRNHQ